MGNDDGMPVGAPDAVDGRGLEIVGSNMMLDWMNKVLRLSVPVGIMVCGPVVGMTSTDSGRLVAVADTAVVPVGAGNAVAVTGNVPVFEPGKVPDVTESAIGLVSIGGELVMVGPLIAVPDPVVGVIPLISVNVPPVADTPLVDTGDAVPINPVVVWPGVTPLSVTGLAVPANPVPEGAEPEETPDGGETPGTDDGLEDSVIGNVESDGPGVMVKETLSVGAESTF